MIHTSQRLRQLPASFFSYSLNRTFRTRNALAGTYVTKDFVFDRRQKNAIVLQWILLLFLEDELVCPVGYYPPHTLYNIKQSY